MTTRAFYNEIDPKMAAWIAELMKEDLIAPGDIDTRSVEDIKPNELLKYTQLHFFAGIAVWSHALRQLGWPDDRRVITGSCPCQPYSSAGKRKGFTDERHLWPAYFHIIHSLQGYPEFRAVPVIGEQVSSTDILPWFDLVCDDLEAAGYTVWPLDFPAAGVGAPQIRNRLYFLADCGGNGRRTRRDDDREDDGSVVNPVCSMGDADLPGSARQRSDCGTSKGKKRLSRRSGIDGVVVDTNGSGWKERNRIAGNDDAETDSERGKGFIGPGFANGFWADAEWLYMRDGKYRPIKPGIFPLANGPAGRVVLLRGAGNAIVPQAAEMFIRSWLEIYES